MKHDSPIYLAGHRGLVGNAVLRRLESGGYTNILTRTHRRAGNEVSDQARTHAELDLTRQSAVESFFETEEPEVVILAAARVGGIMANSTY